MVRAPGSASLLPEVGRSCSGVFSGARARLSLLVLIFMLTVFPEVQSGVE